MQNMIAATLLILSFSVCCIYAEEDPECSIIFESSLKSMSDLIQKIDPMKIKGIPTTEWCNITGLSKLEPMEDKDVITVRNPKQVSSTFFLLFPELEIECSLQLDENPANIPELLVKSEQETRKNSCPQEDRQEVAEEVKNSRLRTMDVKDMLELDACQPKLPKSANDKTKNAKNQGLIHIKWENVKVKFETVVKTGTNNVQINQVDILNKNYDTIDIKCMGNITEFLRPCKCVVASRFPVTFVAHVIDLLLPCRIDKDQDIYKNILEYFICPED